MFTEETNPRSRNIDRLTTLEMLQVINDEDQQVAHVVQKAIPQIAEAVDAVVYAFKQGGRLIYSGAGTSGRLGVLDAVECAPTFSVSSDQIIGLIAGGSGAMMHSIEGAEDKRDLGKSDLQAVNLTARDVVVGIAASGHTPYVLDAVEYANQIGACTVGMSCNVPAPILDLVRIKIALPVGPEVITGSTRMKAGSAQKMALNMLSTAAMVRSGKTYGNLMVDVQVTNDKLARRARNIVQMMTGLDDAASAALLERAGNSVKVAIVMQQRSVTADEARALLAATSGFLHEAINS